jgi:CHAD domain-containing protein
MGNDVRALVVESFRLAIADAHVALAEPSVDVAVHRVRLALRRARAIVRMVRTAIDADVRRELVYALRGARKRLERARDATVLPSTLGCFPFDDEVRTAAAALLSLAHLDAPDTDEIRALLDEATRRAAPLVGVLAAAVPADLSWHDLANGVARTYRRARRALRRARRSHEDLHVLRRRSKELALQLDVLARGIDRRVGAGRKQFARLGDALSDVADGLALRTVLDEYAARHAPDRRAQLIARVDQHLMPRLRASRAVAKPVFERAPRQFVRKVERALRATS